MLPWQKCTENSPSARFLTIRARDAELDTFIQAILRQKQKNRKGLLEQKSDKIQLSIAYVGFFLYLCTRIIKIHYEC